MILLRIFWTILLASIREKLRFFLGTWRRSVLTLMGVPLTVAGLLGVGRSAYVFLLQNLGQAGEPGGGETLFLRTEAVFSVLWGAVFLLGILSGFSRVASPGLPSFLQTQPGARAIKSMAWSLPHLLLWVGLGTALSAPAAWAFGESVGSSFGTRLLLLFGGMGFLLSAVAVTHLSAALIRRLAGRLRTGSRCGLLVGFWILVAISLAMIPVTAESSSLIHLPPFRHLSILLRAPSLGPQIGAATWLLLLPLLLSAGELAIELLFESESPICQRSRRKPLWPRRAPTSPTWTIPWYEVLWLTRVPDGFWTALFFHLLVLAAGGWVSWGLPGGSDSHFGRHVQKTIWDLLPFLWGVFPVLSISMDRRGLYQIVASPIPSATRIFGKFRGVAAWCAVNFMASVCYLAFLFDSPVIEFPVGRFLASLSLSVGTSFLAGALVPSSCTRESGDVRVAHAVFLSGCLMGSLYFLAVLAGGAIREPLCAELGKQTVLFSLGALSVLAVVGLVKRYGPAF